MSVGEIVNRKL